MEKLIYAAVLLGLVSCHNIHEGKVVGKEHEGAGFNTYTTFMYVNGQTIPQVHTDYDDEDFILIVKGFDGKDTTEESFYVDAETWKCKAIGDHFNDSIPCSTEDENNN
jgi:hypothetical protein